MSKTTTTQSGPQIILGGTNLSAMSRDELKQFVINLPANRPGQDALIRMAFRLDAQLRDAECGIDAWEAALDSE